MTQAKIAKADTGVHPDQYYNQVYVARAYDRQVANALLCSQSSIAAWEAAIETEDEDQIYTSARNMRNEYEIMAELVRRLLTDLRTGV